MKKFILFFAILILSQCQISITSKEALAQSDKVSPRCASWIYQADEMSYRIFIYGDEFSYKSSSIYVINITKEKLEVEKLQLEIRNLRKN